MFIEHEIAIGRGVTPALPSRMPGALAPAARWGKRDQQPVSSDIMCPPELHGSAAFFRLTRNARPVSDASAASAYHLGGLVGIACDDLEKFRHVERFRDIVVASAGKNLRPVATHGEGSNGDYRDCPGLLVGLKPTGCLKAGDVWQLDVHQNQIWLVLSSDVEGRFTSASCEDHISMIFEKIV